MRWTKADTGHTLFFLDTFPLVKKPTLPAPYRPPQLLAPIPSPPHQTAHPLFHLDLAKLLTTALCPNGETERNHRGMLPTKAQNLFACFHQNIHGGITIFLLIPKPRLGYKLLSSSQTHNSKTKESWAGGCSPSPRCGSDPDKNAPCHTAPPLPLLHPALPLKYVSPVLSTRLCTMRPRREGRAPRRRWPFENNTKGPNVC